LSNPSAQKQLHSTETALLEMHNDITLNNIIDNGKASLFAFHYLSAVFDTINLTILVDHLSLWYIV